jgi:hypothetical protein
VRLDLGRTTAVKEAAQARQLWLRTSNACQKANQGRLEIKMIKMAHLGTSRVFPVQRAFLPSPSPTKAS